MLRIETVFLVDLSSLTCQIFNASRVHVKFKSLFIEALSFGHFLNLIDECAKNLIRFANITAK